MNIPTKKLVSGFEMPVYGLGTWSMGGGVTHNPDNDDEGDINAIKMAIANGITHIDTAESYAAGYAEILIGKAIKDFDRSKLLIVSKVWEDNLGYKDLIAAAKASLKRLQTDYLDVYMTHRFSLNIPVEETMKAMDKLVDEGLIKQIGVSNYNVEELKKAQSCTKNKIVMNQLHYNLMYREVEKKGLLEYCQQNDLFLVAWRPIQGGILSEKSSPVMQEMVEKYKKTPTQIALNWLISQKNVVTLSKTKSLNHLEENLEALDWTMDSEDIEKLRNEFPVQYDISDAVPLH